MKSYFITFRSITLAQRAEVVLQRSGLKCTLQRTPRWMEERGCGYSLHLRQGEAQRAVEILRGQQIMFSKVYLRREDGTMEELQL